MTVLRWILSYLGVIVILVAVVLGYVYREELMAWFDASDRQLARAPAETQGAAPSAVPTPEGEQRAEAPVATAPEPTKPAQGTPSAAPSFAPPGYEPPGPPAAAPVSEQPSTAGTPASTPSPAPAPTLAPPPVATVPPQESGPAGAAPDISAPSTAAAESATAAPSTPYPAPPTGYRIPPRPAPPVYAESQSRSRAVVVPRPYPAPRPPPRAYPTPSQPAAAISAPPALPDDQRAALSKARDTFWREGPEAAAPLYEAAAEANPENPDLRGELANIYFAMGKRAEATEAYARVVILLHEQGRRGEAARVLRTVAMLDRNRAQELMTELSPPPAPSGERR